MATPEVLVGQTWLPLSRGSGCPRVPESSTLVLRGFGNGETVVLGLLRASADSRGRIELRLSRCEELRGHLGLVEVARESGEMAGEFEIVPDKMSEHAFQTLRSALERMWAGLIFDPDGTSRLRGQMPSPAELWRAIEKPVRDIAAEPRSILARGEGVRRLEAVRRPSELTASVIRASASLARSLGGYDDGPPDSNETASEAALLQRPGRSNVLIREVGIPENALVAETLRRLASYARRQPGGLEVATRANRALRNHPFDSCQTLHGGIEAARVRILHDPRYRQSRQSAAGARQARSPRNRRTRRSPTRCQGDDPPLRILGISPSARRMPAAIRAPDRAGLQHPWAAEPSPEPLDWKFHQEQPCASRRGVHVAFEPRITSSGRGWQGTRERATPQPEMAQMLITPDVVVLRLGPRPGRRSVRCEVRGPSLGGTRSSQDPHPLLPHPPGRASRSCAMSWPPTPTDGIDYLWAGYGSVPMIPGKPADLTELLP